MKRRPYKKPMAEINVVPYIDVMLVLLIIFMITAPLLKQGVEVKLPEASARRLKSSNRTPIIISIDKTGRYYLNIAAHPKRPLPAQVLVHQVQEAIRKETQPSSRPVLIKGDQAVPYGKVVQAMTALQKKGITQLGLVTSDPDYGAAAH